MKKYILLYNALLLGAISLTSCTDMLNKEPLAKFSDSSTFWNNPSSVEGYANTFYNLFKGYGNGNASGDFYFTSLMMIKKIEASKTGNSRIYQRQALIGLLHGMKSDELMP